MIRFYYGIIIITITLTRSISSSSPRFLTGLGLKLGPPCWPKDPDRFNRLKYQGGGEGRSQSLN